MHDAPPITLHTDLVEDADTLFGGLLRAVQWDNRMRARRTASFGRAYGYSGITYPATSMPDTLSAVGARVAAAVGFTPNTCLMNLYPDGEARMGFHADAIDQLAPGTGVAIVSLGAVRSITFRRQTVPPVEHRLRLPAGSLLYMPPEMQAHWKHAIEPEPGAGARIGMTFRRLAD